MNKKIIVIVSLIVLVLLASLFFLKNKESIEQKTGNTTKELRDIDTLENIDNIESIDTQDLIDKIDKKYLSNNQFKSCAEDSIKSCFNQSVYNKLNTDKDISICNDFWQKEEQDSCRSTFISAQAREKKDHSICDSLENSESCKSEVYMAIALESKDLSKCEILKKTKSDSNELDGVILDDFIYRDCKTRIVDILVSETGDSKYCEKLDSKEDKEFCLNNARFAEELELNI